MKNCWFALLVPAAFIPLSCAPRTAELPSDYAALVRNAQGRARLLGLLELDQAHPGSLALKVDLGAAFLALGDLEQARIYLGAGKRLAARSKDGQLVALLHAGLAELAWQTGDYDQAARCCETALSLGPEDPAGARFTRARSLAALGETTRALEDFALGWDRQRATMRAEDYIVYARLLAQGGSERRALEVLAERKARFPHGEGISLEESALYERLGLLEESVLCAYEELEYQLYAGGTSVTSILEGLSALERRLGALSPEAGRPARRIAAGLSHHARGQWAHAAEELSNVGAVSALPFGRYILLSARLESGRATGSDFQSYLSLEGLYRDLAGYYYHLWRGLKASGSAAGPPIEILEKCILLAPRTRAAAESRRELARALGLDPADGEKLLLPSELDAIDRAVRAGGDPTLLLPVLELLSTPANRYQARAELMLRALARRRDIRVFLEARQENAGGRLGERLAFLLEG